MKMFDMYIKWLFKKWFSIFLINLQILHIFGSCNPHSNKWSTYRKTLLCISIFLRVEWDHFSIESSCYKQDVCSCIENIKLSVVLVMVKVAWGILSRIMHEICLILKLKIRPTKDSNYIYRIILRYVIE